MSGGLHACLCCWVAQAVGWSYWSPSHFGSRGSCSAGAVSSTWALNTLLAFIKCRCVDIAVGFAVGSAFDVGPELTPVLGTLHAAEFSAAGLPFQERVLLPPETKKASSRTANE